MLGCFNGKTKPSYTLNGLWFERRAESALSLQLREVTMLRVRDALAALILAGSPSFGNAAPCAGFTDVDSASVSAESCTAVEWLKNRSVTLGCTSTTLFCPGNPVSRLQMALFMNRLGKALAPTFLGTAGSGPGTQIPANGVVCQTAPYVVQDYPRLATARAMLVHGGGLASQQVNAYIVYSVNGGMTWPALSAIASTAVNLPQQFVSQSLNMRAFSLNVGASVMFGIYTFGSTPDGFECEIWVRIESYNGTSSPFDGLGIATE